MVRAERDYRWVGIYKIERGEFVIVGRDGQQAADLSTISENPGALRRGRGNAPRRSIVGDVRKDARWLPAFWTTKSEIVVPIKSESNGQRRRDDRCGERKA